MREKLKQSKISIISIILLLINLQMFAQTPLFGNKSGLLTKANSPYLITGNVTVPTGQTLTIEAGVEIRSQNYADVFEVYGTLVAIGSPSDSIRFNGFPNLLNSSSTHGGSLRFQPSSVASELRFVSFKNMGADNYWGDVGSIYINTQNVNIANIQIKNSRLTGIVIENNVSPTITNCNFSNNPNDILTYINSCSGISQNQNAKIKLQSGTTGKDGILKKQGNNSAFVLKNSQISIAANDTITIEPGVIIYSLNNTDYISINGTLIAKGTSTDSVKFIGVTDINNSNSTHGGSLRFLNGSINSELEFVSFEKMGADNHWGDYGTLYCNTSNLKVTKSVIKNSRLSGIKIENNVSPTVTNCNFIGNPNDILTYIGSCSGISQNQNAKINLQSGTTSRDGVLKKQGNNSSFTIKGSQISIAANDTITIESGVIIYSQSNLDFISVGGTLLAKGTSIDSIKFIGLADPGNISSTHGGSLRFLNGSINSDLKFVSFDRMGANNYWGDYGAIYSNTSKLTISNCQIKNSNSTGILVENNISPTVINCSFSNNPNDILTYISSCSGISQNQNAKIKLQSGTTNRDGQLKKQGNNSSFIIKSSQISIAVNNTITIEPGVIIYSLSNTDYINVNGTLIAKGTSVDSIKFIGVADIGNSNSTHGGSLRFLNGSINSELEFVSFEKMGADNHWGDYGAVYTNTSNIKITKSVIKNSRASGIKIENNVSPTITNCNFSNNPNDILTYINSCSGIFQNQNAKIKLQSGTTGKDGILKKQGNNSAFVLKNSQISIAANDTITIEPGVIIYSQNYLDYISVAGTLLAKGLPTDSIKLIGEADIGNASSTHGGSIRFINGSINSELKFVSFSRMGANNYWGDYGSIYSNTSSLTISNCQIKNSNLTGIVIENNLSPIITNCIFSNNPNAISTYITSCSGISQNQNAKIIIQGATINTNLTLPYPGQYSYYYLNGSITVPITYTLTIEPGVTVDFGTAANEINISGTLKAVGTELSPILFYRNQLGFYNGNTNLNASSTGSILSYVTFDKLGGNAGYPALDVATSNFSSSNLTFSNCYLGIRYQGGNAPIFSGSSFYNNGTGIQVDNGRPIFNNCNIYANTDFGINNTSGAIADTVDARNCYWGHPSGPNHPSLNPAGQGNKVSDKVKFYPIKSQPQNGQVLDIGVSALLAPVTDCNLTNTTDIIVRVSNFGNTSISNFPIFYQINNGAIINETVSGATLLPGRTYDYTFTAKANLATVGSFAIKCYTKLALDSLKTNDTLRTVIQNLPTLAAPTNLTPNNNTSGLDISVALSWSAIANVTSYDIFYWKSTDPIPTIPTISNLTQINYVIPFGVLNYGTQYSWKVVAKKISCRAESAVQTFTTRQLPNLKVENIIVPPTGISENNISIQYTVKNYGTGGTGTTAWQDVIYLCDQPVLFGGVDNFYVGSVQNLSALNQNEQYTSQVLSFKIPQGKVGNYYVIVKTNASQSLVESNLTDNQRVSNPINVSLAPPPDLQIVAPVLASPQSVFSDDTLTVTYTVKNFGTGPTTSTNWVDYIYLTQDEVFNPLTGNPIETFNRTQSLASNAQYTITKKIKLPNRISGTYYVHLFADRFNSVFEYNKEDNNTGTSLPITITQKPTPDLTVNNVNISLDSISNNQAINIQWITSNEGTTIAKSPWQENIYYSTSNTFTGSTYLNAITQNTSINSLNSISGQQSVNIPATLIEGDYYFFVKTDANDNIYENPDTESNISLPSTKVRVVNADLLPTILNAPTSALSEQSIVVQWKVRNQSRGLIINNSWNDRFYLSTNTTFEPSTDILLGSANSSQLLGKGAEYQKQTSLTIPEGTPTGSYHLLLVSDADNNVFEKIENNNITSRPITITLAPWADLRVSSVSGPPVDTIGTTINVQYSVQNIGTGNINSKTWNDQLYLSPSNNLAETNLIPLGSVAQTRSLLANQSYSQSLSVTIPNIAAGTYYLLLKTDFNNTIFENVNENNNTGVSVSSILLKIIVVTPPQPIDLSVSNGQILSTTVTAGLPVNIEWTVKNNSAISTIAPNWKDAVYLNNSPIINQNATLLSTITINNPLTAGATYTRSATVTIPQTASGTLYVLVNTDKDNQNLDDARGNNTLALNTGSGGSGVIITIPPPADLIPTAFTSATQGIVAQPIAVNFTVKNQGTGPTPAGNWTDIIYLSSDLQLDGSDIQIGSFARNNVLVANGTYNVTGQVFLPNSISGGNYVLILKTDANDDVFERNTETNNTIITNIFINAQQPSDLSISNIVVPSTNQFAGNNTTISWNIKNIGGNTANGFKRDAVYFSKDSLLDASDVLFGVLDKSIFLPTEATDNNTITNLLSNVTVGEYFVLVKTDILNNIIETNESNNLSKAVGKLTVRVKELPIAVLTSDTLRRSEPLYYRIEIPQNLVGETLQIDLKGDSTNVATNRFYLSYAKTPSENDYEIASTIPFSANQRINVASLSAGTYYITSFGELPNQTKQKITLFAKIIPFSITSVVANQGGNTGLITVKVTGAKFDKQTTFKLQKGTNVISSTKVFLIDQTAAYVTFNLIGKAIGDYDVVATKPNNSSTSLINGFKVIQGPAGGFDGNGSGFICSITNIGFEDGLETAIVAPTSARLNQVLSMVVTFKNTSSVDIPVQTRFLVSLNENNPIGFAVADLTQNKQDLILVCEEQNGPPGILRPGAEGFFKVYAVSKSRAVASIDLTIIE